MLLYSYHFQRYNQEENGHRLCKRGSDAIMLYYGHTGYVKTIIQFEFSVSFVSIAMVNSYLLRDISDPVV
jgi:hypothetical protein